MSKRNESNAVGLGLNDPINWMGNIARYFIKNKSMTFLLMLVILVLGASSIVILPKESLPEIVFPRILVQTIYPGASALDVEQLVTDPLEAKLSGLSDLEGMTSESSANFSVIALSLSEGVDVQQKSLEIQGLLAEVSLPEGVDTPKTSIFRTSELPILSFAVAGPYNLATLEAISEDIQAAIEKVGGVDEVNLVGGRGSEIQVILNPYRLYQANLTLDDVSRSLKARNLDFPVGEQEIGGINFNLRISGALATIDEIGQVMITGTRGQKVQLAELGEVKLAETEAQRLNRTFFREGDTSRVVDSIYGTVLRKNGADVIGTSDAIRAAIISGKGIVYPQDVEVSILYDNATNVRKDLGNIQFSAISGLLVVVLVLFLFIGLKESLIVSITIPLSLMMTLGFLNYFGISLNTFAILGLIVALGLLVDNSIIVMENMDRLYRMGVSPLKAALVGVNQVALPVLSSTLTTVAAFLPLAILPGTVGAFINTIPRTIIIALIASLLVSLTITPSIYALVIGRYHRRLQQKAAKIEAVGTTNIQAIGSSTNQQVIGTAAKPRRRLGKNLLGLTFVAALSFLSFYDPLASIWIPMLAVLFFTVLMGLKLFVQGDRSLEDSGLVKGYKAILTAITQKTWRQVLALFLAFGVLVGTGALIPLGVLKINFFPQNEPTALDISIDTPGGTTLEGTQAIVSQVEAVLTADPTIEVFNVAVGGIESDIATISATLYDKGARDGISGFTILSRIDSQVTKIPGASITVSGTAGGGPPVGKPIAYEFIAEDYQAGRTYAETFRQRMSGVAGIINAEVSVKDGAPDLAMTVNANRAADLGLSVAQIAGQVRVALDGEVATAIKAGKDLIDVRLRYQGTNLEPQAAVEAIFITTPQGVRIPITEVVSFTTTQGISSIQHQEGKRVITLDADLLEGYNSGDVTKAIEAATADLEIPRGVSLKVSGDAANIQESFLTLFQSMLLAILLVFVILTIQFKSVAQPFAILITVPMALIGVFWGLIITGNEFGFYAFMGLVSLVGIAVNDAIVLIDYMNTLRRDGLPLQEALVEAGATRFSPVFSTTLTTIGGVLPLAFREVYYAQFSFSLVFGLLVTTVMTLIFIPIVYNLIERIKGRKGSKGVSSYDIEII